MTIKPILSQLSIVIILGAFQLEFRFCLTFSIELFLPHMTFYCCPTMTIEPTLCQFSILIILGVL